MLDIEPVEAQDGLEVADTSKGVALIDADTLVYTTCLEVEWAEECLPRAYYTDSEWQELIDDPDYYEPDHTIYRTDYDMLLKVAKSRIEEIRYLTNTKDVELYFSSGKTFRHELQPTYKGNRKSMRYPAGLEWLKSEMCKHFNGTVCDGFEADDIVVYLKRTNPKKYILTAIDKDVLKSVPGKHFDYYVRRMEFTETDVQTATKWPYIQTLMGDTADNIPGLKGIGAKRAEKALEECILPCECWEVVVGMYLDKGYSIKEAIETMRLVNMHQLTLDKNGNYKIELWQPPCKTKYEE